MLLYLLLFSLYIALGSMNTVTQEQREHVASEGSPTSLSCGYTGSIYNVQWYRQQQRSRPEFLLYVSESGSIHPTRSDFSAHINKTQKRGTLLISSAAVTDSAVYYCAVTTGNSQKIVFGTGTSLTIETKNEIEPDYYNLDYDGTRVCLATGFTRLNATMMTPGFQNQSASQITDHKGEPTGFYSQVAFQEDGEECENEKQGEGEITKPDQCDAELEPDEMVNLASITIFGLRIIFIKTVAFNVLMTLRLWTSQ